MNDSVKSATRVLDLMELFSVTSEPLGVSDVAKKMFIPKSSAQSLLLTLTGRGYLVRDDVGYSLPIEMRGGWVGGIRSWLLGIAMPVLQEMAKESKESAFIGVLTGAGAVQYLAKAVSPLDVRYDTSLDPMRPIHATSMGLVFMAHATEKSLERWLQPSRLLAVTPATQTAPDKIRQSLPVIRKNGYAEIRDGNVEGASGVSAPIFGSHDNVVAALNIGAPTFRYEGRRANLIRIVCREAAHISKALSEGIGRK